MERLNLGVLAHVDAGKTTTVERILYQAGAIKTPGSVDDGSSQLDWLPIERARGISVRAASTVLHHGGRQINIIDTPGHTDFAGEVERALYALDGVVLVVSALEGVQGGTELLFKAVRGLGLPCVLFLNKLDRVGCEPAAVLAELRQKLSPAVIPLYDALGAGTPECGVAPHTPDEEDILALCEADVALQERFLGDEPIDTAAFAAALRRATAAGEAFPLVVGSAMQGVGMGELLDAIVEYLPSPPPVEGLAGVVYRVDHDPDMGKVCHLRLFGGSLRNRDEVALQRPGADEPLRHKITHIRRSAGPKLTDTGLLEAGDIAAVYGLTGARAGDIIGERLERQGYPLAHPVLSVQVAAQNAGDAPRLLEAIAQLADEDPLLGHEWVPEKRELHLKIMGRIQLEVLEASLRERYGLAVVFSPPSVLYRETPLRRARGYERYTMPKPCWAVVELEIEPLARGRGFQYESRVGKARLAERYQNHVAASVPEALAQGRLGWQVTDVKVSLVDGEHHLVHTHPLDFFLATPIAVQDGLHNAGAALLEPLLILRLAAPEDCAGRLIGDVVNMRGSFDSPVVRAGQVMVEARVPVATSMDYPARFQSATGGRGALQSAFGGYQECPLELGAVAERRGVDPLDRAKWILHRRGALG